MTGFIAELIHPNQVIIAKVNSGLLIQLGHIPIKLIYIRLSPKKIYSNLIPAMMLVTKNGNQHMIKIPITVPSVLAAFVSFENLKRCP